MHDDIKFKKDVDKQLRDAFPYYEPTERELLYKDNIPEREIIGALVGNSDNHESHVQIRITYNKSSVTFGIVDGCYNTYVHTIEDLKESVSSILKRRIDKDKNEKKSAMKADLESMKLCGFLTRNDLKYTLEQTSTSTIVNIFGTAFEKLPIYIYKNAPDVYVIATPRASFNQEQVENFIRLCKSLKE